MTEIYVLGAVAVEEHARGRLEDVLRDSGYAIVPVDALSTADPAAEDQRQLRAAVTALVDAAGDAELKRLEAAVTSEPADDLDERFWGPAPDSVTATRAAFDDLSEQFARRRQLAAEGISREQAADLLGVSAQSVTAKLASGKLVGIKDRREWRLPTWQFDADNPTGVLPDLDALQAVFPGGPVSLTRWMLRGQPEFSGRTGREEMVVHGSEPVIELARVLTAVGW